MPTRVVRGEILKSHSLSRVSLGAELLFRNLIALVDDYGRYDGDPEIIAAHAYPRRREIRAKQVSGWIDELANADGDGLGPVLIYVVDGKPYLQLVNWEKHRGQSRRGSSSRWPDPAKSDPEAQYRPSAEILGDPRGPARGVGESRSRGVEESVGVGPNRRPAARAAASAPARIDPRVEEAWPAIREAFAQHGCSLGERVGHDRAELIAKRMAEGATSDDLVAAVHGYVQIHDGLKPDPKSGFDPRKWFQPKTVFKHEAFSDRVDAGRSRNVKHIDQERMARLKERWRV